MRTSVVRGSTSARGWTRCVEIDDDRKSTICSSEFISYDGFVDAEIVNLRDNRCEERRKFPIFREIETVYFHFNLL